MMHVPVIIFLIIGASAVVHGGRILGKGTSSSSLESPSYRNKRLWTPTPSVPVLNSWSTILPTPSPTPTAYRNTSCIGAFLNNGSFCSDVSFVCPGPVDSSGDCPALYYCFLPVGTTGTLTPPNGTNLHNSTATRSPSSPSSCSSSSNILSVLAILNILDSSFSLVFGHEAIRRRLARFRCLRNSNGDGKEEQWSLTAGLVGALIHIIPMLISAGITTSKNPGMGFVASLGMWSMRPRGTFITMLIMQSMPSTL